MYLEYSDKEISYLKGKDKRLGAAIDRIGHIYRTVDEDLFSSVVNHMIGQQISTRAQQTIWQRLCDKLSEVTADRICSLEIAELQSIGMTFKKAEYIYDFAQKVRDRAIEIETFYTLSDAALIQELSALKGIGVWTAQMIMIFCLQRPDIVSFGDLAIHRGMRMLYHHKSIDKQRFEKYAKRYSPYGTVASLYLWAIAGGAIPQMHDYAPAKKKVASNDKARNVDCNMRK